MLLRQEDVRELMGVEGRPCVSIYMPGETAGRDTMQGPIRLRNLLRIATEQLAANNIGERQAEALLRPAAQLLEDNAFWQHQNHGLALFISDGFFRELRVPLPFNERVAVGERFHLRPLLSLLSQDGRFYLLMLSQKQVRLYEASRQRMQELAIPGVPRDITEVVGRDYEEKSLQFHTRTSNEGGMQPGHASQRRAMYFGQGENADQDKNEIERFVRAVDEGIQQVVPDTSVPLILAAVDYIAAIYRQVSTYPRLVEETLAGNFEHLSDDALHKLALPIMQRRFDAAREAAVQRYAALAGTQGASAEPQTILPAAFDGRIDTLFVASDEDLWGRFESETHRTESHHERQPGDADLLELATFKALDSGAKLYAAPSEQLPARPIAAVFRY